MYWDTRHLICHNPAPPLSLCSHRQITLPLHTSLYSDTSVSRLLPSYPLPLASLPLFPIVPSPGLSTVPDVTVEGSF
ncbi:hypothetical protein E2C01_088582 [Portunus trituberculatus]|uniref:Uncharacterized protein n=1 Tax=Portunus trituberculatus TaxID=210409 RepID=A0A5B7JGE5_PORTR|nr:hypothetical protein [Portunus trituberculatus]